MRWHCLLLVVMLAVGVTAQGATIFYGTANGIPDGTNVTAKVGLALVGSAIVKNGQYGYEPQLLVRGATGEVVTFYDGQTIVGQSTIEIGASQRVDLWTPDAKAMKAIEDAQPVKSATTIPAGEKAPAKTIQQSPVRTALLKQTPLPSSTSSSSSSILVPSLLSAATVLVVIGLVGGLVVYRRHASTDNQLRSYVQRMRSSGYSAQQVAGTLKQQGWSDDAINKAFR